MPPADSGHPGGHVPDLQARGAAHTHMPDASRFNAGSTHVNAGVEPAANSNIRNENSGNNPPLATESSTTQYQPSTMPGR